MTFIERDKKDYCGTMKALRAMPLSNIQAKIHMTAIYIHLIMHSLLITIAKIKGLISKITSCHQFQFSIAITK